MKSAVIVFPGSNCDRDAAVALERITHQKPAMIWHRETELKGAYTYGTETMPDGSRRRTFDLALETAGAVGIERLLSATYGLADHVDAIAHAAAAGRRGAIKIAFDLRGS